MRAAPAPWIYDALASTLRTCWRRAISASRTMAISCVFTGPI